MMAEEEAAVPPQPQQPMQIDRLVVNNRNPALAALRPKQFTGDVENAPHFLRAFERYAIASGIPDGEKPVYLALLCDGTAEAWFTHLPQEVKNNWQQLRQQFQNKYILAPHIDVKKRLDAMTSVQGPTEPIEAYIQRMRTKMTDLGYDEQLQCSIIIQNMKSAYKKYALLGLPYDNLDILNQKMAACELSFRSDVNDAELHIAQVQRSDTELLKDAIVSLSERVNQLCTEGARWPLPQDNTQQSQRRPQQWRQPDWRQQQSANTSYQPWMSPRPAQTQWRPQRQRPQQTWEPRQSSQYGQPRPWQRPGRDWQPATPRYRSQWNARPQVPQATRDDSQRFQGNGDGL